MESIKTKSGIQPVVTNELPFEITTEQVERFIQRKMDLVKDRLGDIEVKIFTTETSKKFLPFVVLLPESVVDGGNNRRPHSNNRELGIFSQQNDDGGGKIRLKREAYELFAAYMYNKDDETAFFSPDWRRVMGIPSSVSAKLRYARTPHIQPYNNGKTKFVSFLIDPIRVFYDMVMESGQSPRYRIDINNIEKINTGVFKYSFFKSVKKNKKEDYNFDEVLAREITQKMR